MGGVLPKKARKKARKEVDSVQKIGFAPTSVRSTAKKSAEKSEKRAAQCAEDRFCANEHGGNCDKKRKKKREKKREKRCTLHRSTCLPL